MSRRQLTYNPGLLTEDELLETFIVRGIDLDLIVETIRDNDGPSNQHVVVVGARGMGKTTLVFTASENEPGFAGENGPPESAAA